MSSIVSFGEWVQKRRNQLRLSRPALARQMGCAPITIKKIERDERRPSLQIAKLLAQHLQIPESEQEDFIRRARGQFVAQMSDPTDIPLILPNRHRYRLDLPAQSTSFIGREEDLAKIAKLITNPDGRLVTILGEGGMGKTRLAMEAAKSYENDFINGIIFVPLAPVDLDSFSGSLDPISASIAGQLNFAFRGDGAPQEQLFNFLQDKEMLLVLDNFEHLIDHAAILGELLTVAASIKILVTSRESLNLQAEWLLTLAGLPMQTAVSLFEQRAMQVKHAFSLSPEIEAVQHICRLVDGMPLGLELAAAWVRTMSCAAIASEIEKSIDILASKMRNLPARHRSLRALFDSSWQLLSAKEQADLQKLSVFRGGFELEAATAVSGASLYSLSNLVDKSLLKVQQGRYQIHERLRQFAAEKLDQSDNSTEQIRTQHARVYLDNVAQQAPKLRNREIKAALSRLSDELDNIRAALRWAIRQNWFPEIIEVVSDIWIFYDIKGLLKEIVETLNSLVTRLRFQEKSHGNALTNELTSPYTLWLGQALALLATFQVRLGSYETAKAMVQESTVKLHAAPKTSPQELYSFVIHNGITLSLVGKTVEGMALLQEGLSESQGMIDQWLQAGAMTVIGMNYRTLGQNDQAHKWLQESGQLLQSEGECFLNAYILSTLGRIAAEQGQYREADDLLTASMEMRADINDKAGIVFSFRDLGDLSQLEGKLAQAKNYYEQGLALSQNINLGIVTPQLWWGLGNLAVREGAFAKARQMYKQCQIKDRGYYFANSIIANPGWADIGLGEQEVAEASFRQMLNQGLESGTGRLLSEAMTGFAYLKAQIGAFELAIEWLALIIAHPYTIQDSKDRAEKLLAEFRAELPTQVVAAAEARGRELDLWQTAKTLLAEDIES